MLREIRMCGNFRAAFFLAEPVFPVALTECGGCPSVADTTLTSKGILLKKMAVPATGAKSHPCSNCASLTHPCVSVAGCSKECKPP